MTEEEVSDSAQIYSTVCVHVGVNIPTNKVEPGLNPDNQPEPTKPGLPPGFVCPHPDEMSQGDWLFVHFIGHGPEEVRAAQTISQRLSEAAGEAHSTHFT